MKSIDLSINALHDAYRDGSLSPLQLLGYIVERSNQYKDDSIWITQLNKSQIEEYVARLPQQFDASLPLYGIPFAIKDNIDLAGCDTSAACKAFAHQANDSATVVQLLLDAGAIPIGKTNLDQFATGLVGTRSDYGICVNPFDRNYLSGGSSSGSAVAVALGLCSFSLGTDTAGSGRVPAAFNNIVGLKPSKGLLSCNGVLPACRSLDCVSIFALNADDANLVFEVAARYDEGDVYARQNPFYNSKHCYGKTTESFRFGVLAAEQFAKFQNEEYSKLYLEYCDRLSSLGGSAVTVDFSPFSDAARLLYDGPWVAERYAAIEEFIRQRQQEMHPVTREIIGKARALNSINAFKAFYQLQAYKQAADNILKTVDFVVTPTTVDHYSIEAEQQQPIKLNSQLGYYTNFMNLLDLSAVAVPAAMRDEGLPYGVTLFSSAFSDRKLMSFARRLQELQDWPVGKTEFLPRSEPVSGAVLDNYVDVVVCGAHLSGFPLNWQLRERSAVLLREDKTAPVYRLYAISGAIKRPGLVRNEQSGIAISVELWRVPMENFASFVAAIPEPLGIGKVQLSDGKFYSGFICENYALESAQDITDYGGWAAYMQT